MELQAVQLDPLLEYNPSPSRPCDLTVALQSEWSQRWLGVDPRTGYLRFTEAPEPWLLRHLVQPVDFIGNTGDGSVDVWKHLIHRESQQFLDVDAARGASYDAQWRWQPPYPVGGAVIGYPGHGRDNQKFELRPAGDDGVWDIDPNTGGSMVVCEAGEGVCVMTKSQGKDSKSWRVYTYKGSDGDST
eukprot:TRINITY_DN3535_c0_g2_i1.p1 TRINITY_DN3535_c0_g2~~TRINITY_DN3535_c0_g2_i1.p1  ORF type:complete len:187 (-),score=24.75 TRINITY_DN3535_c0_g2_i1:375-935(-)